MGMKIFTKSGTFNPADYGLKAGDSVDLIVVGGGQGGTAGSSAMGGNGASSSFGSHLTACGGSSTAQRYANGNGGFILPVYGISDSRGTTDFNGMFAGGGSGKYNSSETSYRVGGNGYGAGGGGVANTNYDGIPGELKYGSAILTGATVAVSVGGGGSGGALYRSSQANGNDGTTSGGGTSVYPGTYPGNATSGAGGYDNEKGGDGIAAGTSNYSAYAGGGGAGGVVIVFW